MPWIIGGAVLGSAVLGAVGANQSNKRSQKAVDRQYDYDVEAYDMNIEKMEADYDYLVEKILSQERNFDTQRAYKDQLAIDTYNRELQIAQIERQTNARAFAKSEQIYGTTLGLNAVEREYSETLRIDNVRKPNKLLRSTINKQLLNLFRHRVLH